MASKLANAATQGLDSLAGVFFPYASAVKRNEDPEALAEITVDGTRAAMFVGMLISLLFLIMASPGIHAWVGVGYGTSARVLVVLAAAIALASPVRVTTVVLAGSDRLPLVSLLRGAEIAIDLALSVTLALVLGPVGVAVGTLGGILLVRLPGNLIFGSRAVGVRPFTMVRRAIVPHLLPMAACAGVLFALRGVAGHALGLVLLVGVAGCIAYAAVFFTVSATPGERRRALAGVTRLLPRALASRGRRHPGGSPGPRRALAVPPPPVKRCSPPPPPGDGARPSATARLYGFLKSNRLLDTVAVWISRRVRESPPDSRLNAVLGPLRARFRGEMTGPDVLAVVDALEAAGVRFWIAGGWGIDLLAGEQARRHDDLDVLLADYAADEPRTRAALEPLGYQHVEVLDGLWMHPRSLLDDKAGHQIEVLGIDAARLAAALGWSDTDRAAAGTPVHERAPHLFTTGTYAGRRVPCLSVELQLLFHTGFDLRGVDGPDIERLRSLAPAAPAPPAP